MPPSDWPFIVSATQTALLLVMTGATVFTWALLRRDLRSTARGFKQILDGQADTKAQLDRLERKTGGQFDHLSGRVLAIEARLGIRSDGPSPAF